MNDTHFDRAGEDVQHFKVLGENEPEDGQLSTDRLLLRAYRPEDLQDFYEMVSNPAVVRFEPYGPLTMEQATEELDRRRVSGEFTAVVLKSSGKVIGNIYLAERKCGAMEIGYLLNESWWGKGYAAEACKAVIEQAFTGGVSRITAQCDPQNTASWRLLERLGFLREGHLRRNVYFRRDEQGKPLWKDTYLYAILREGAAALNEAHGQGKQHGGQANTLPATE